MALALKWEEWEDEIEKKRRASEKAEKWAMLKWINKYIDENQEKWDEYDLIKIQEKFEENEYETSLFV